MIIAKKIRLFPTKEQEEKMIESCNTARYIYNYTLAKQEQNYKDGNQFIKNTEIRKELTKLKKTEKFSWLNNVSNNVTKQAVKDACNAYIKYFKRLSEKPRFKKKGKSRESFYNDDYKLKIKEESLLIEKVGWVRIQPDQVDKNKHYTNPRVSYDGKYWYISLSYNKETIKEELTDEVIGIDVGIKNLATCSNGYIVKNINKLITIKKLEKRKKRLQRQISRKFEKNIKGKEYIKTKNIEKSLKKQKLIERRMRNIRMNQIHQATSTIIKAKTCRVVMEELDIQTMKKDKHLAYLLQGTMMYEFKRVLKYKCELHSIDFKTVDKYYASSKICSCCGNRIELTLKDRIFKCSCGFETDRDINAAINIAAKATCNSL